MTDPIQIKKIVTFQDSNVDKVLTQNGSPVMTTLNLEEVTTQITGGTTEITPSSNKDGISKATVTIPVYNNSLSTNDSITIPNIITTGTSLNTSTKTITINAQATPVLKAQDFVVYDSTGGINGTTKTQSLSVPLESYLIDNTSNPITQNGNNIDVTNYKRIKVQVEGTGTDVSGVTATAPDVANSKVFVNSDGNSVTGSMNLNDLTLTPTTSQQTWDTYNQAGNYTCYKKVICNAINTATKTITPMSTQQTYTAPSGTYWNKVICAAASLSIISFDITNSLGSSNDWKYIDFSLPSDYINKQLLYIGFFALDTGNQGWDISDYHVLISSYFYNASGLSLNTTHDSFGNWLKDSGGTGVAVIESSNNTYGQLVIGNSLSNLKLYHATLSTSSVSYKYIVNNQYRVICILA